MHPAEAPAPPDAPAPAAPIPPCGPGGQAVHLAARGALLESRQRWRDLAGLAADLLFETDAGGRLTFLAPDRVLGWPAAALLGRGAAEVLLLRPEPDPFGLRGPARDLRAWLRRAEGGEAACLSFAVAPLAGAAGAFAGLRGCARDVTAEVAEAAAQAEALRRAVALQALVRRVREAVLAPRMLPALLDLLPAAIGCTGAAVVEIGPDGRPAEPAAAAEGPDPLPAAMPALPAGVQDAPAFLRAPGGEVVAVVPQTGPLLPDGTRRQALVAWRGAGGCGRPARPFDEDERHLLGGLSDLLGVVLGNQRLVQELERQARTEALTGLLNRRAFLEELRRRLGRLARARQGGALLFLDVDNLKPVNDALGHGAGDAALVAVAGLLRRSARPTDLAARLGGDEFALWLDGADAAAAASRAAAICAGAAAGEPRPSPCRGVGRPTVSLGCAVADPGRPEAAEALLARADLAMYAAKRGGRNGWRLAPPAGHAGLGPGAA